MIEPKEITIKTQAGVDKIFTISKFPAIAGREIIAKYPLSGMPKIGDYQLNEETMLKLMCYVSAKTADGGQIALTTKELINNHIPEWETLARVEIEMMGYNCSFFQQGKISNFLDTIKANVEQSVSSMLMGLSEQLLQQTKQPSNNSKQSTV
jgi:hypothetical protein